MAQKQRGQKYAAAQSRARQRLPQRVTAQFDPRPDDQRQRQREGDGDGAQRAPDRHRHPGSRRRVHADLPTQRDQKNQARLHKICPGDHGERGRCAAGGEQQPGHGLSGHHGEEGATSLLS